MAHCWSVDGVRLKKSAFFLLFLLGLSSFMFLAPSPQQAHALGPVLNNTNILCQGNHVTTTCLIKVNTLGDSIFLSVSGIEEMANASTLFVTTVTDNQSNSWTLWSKAQLIRAANCGIAACIDSEVWSARATASGHSLVSIHWNAGGSGTNQQTSHFLFDVSGVSPNAIGTAGGTCNVCPDGTPVQTSSTNAFQPGQTFLLASLWPPFTFGGGTTYISNGASYTLFYQGAGNEGGGEYSISASSPTDYGFTCVNCAGHTILFVEAAAAFGPGPSGRFTCSITNMDAGSYLVAGINKYYDFLCNVQSSGISFFNYPINDVQIKFNDSYNTYVFEYNNSTGIATIDSGSSASLLGTPTVVQSYNAGVRSMNITFPISLNQYALDSLNRGLQLYAQSGGNTTRGFEYVHKNYFNIINKGGQTTFKLNGLCSIPSGADQFQAICAYGANSHNWIAMNATYYQLLSYQTQFAIELRNLTGGLDMPTFWQNYANSGAGTNPSSNKGDWRLNFGFYHWDNTSSTCCWVKGVNVVLQMLQGRVGANNLWTQFDALWYNGATLITNQTLIDFVPSGSAGLGPSSVNIWLNLWYSQNNASTSQGGEVGAFYTGMHNVSYLVWSSWSPFQGNQTQSQTLMPLLDHTGATMSVQQAQFTKVYMNMTRPGAPLAHAKQYNFEIETDQFQIQEFNIASAGMTGIATPVFAVAIVPTIQSSSIFSPIINAIKSIATFISKALVALGTYVWNGLAARFPWFTGTLTAFSALMQQYFFGELGLLNDVVNALKFVFGLIKLLIYPISIITGAYGFLQSSYMTVFGGVSLTAMIEVAVIFFFTTWFFETMESKNPAEGLVKMASTAWHILDTIAYWTWAIAKLLIDSIEGLIP